MVTTTTNEAYHFIGIKGAGMSALAQIMHDMGYKVKGSDIKEHFFTQEALMKRRIPIYRFAAENIKETDKVIISRAFNESNPEVAKSLEENDSAYYYEFLGNFIENFNRSIAISGSHGKTSTTGLMAHVLSQLDNTSYLIGDGTGKGKKDSNYFVFEACEYKNHFLSYSPNYAIITNIDYDHPDFFKSKEDVVESFQKFAKNVKSGLVVYGDQLETEDIRASVPTLRYGLSQKNDVYALNIQNTEEGTNFDLWIKGKRYCNLHIPMVGTHHVLNTLAIFAVLYMEGFDLQEISEERMLSTYGGVKRRFNETTIGSNLIIDDYAHHPTEIKATLESIRLKYPTKRAVVLFQPHTYSRTKALFNGFVDTLQQFDEVYLADIFGSAREKSDIVGITSQDIVDAVSNNKKELVGDTLPESFYAYEDTVIAFLGAGDVNKYKNEYLMKKA